MPVWTVLYFHQYLNFARHVGGVAYWTISGRIGALKTLGRGIVFDVAAPSAPTMPTVGLEVIVAAGLVCCWIKPGFDEVQNPPTQGIFDDVVIQSELGRLAGIISHLTWLWLGRTVSSPGLFSVFLE